MFKALLLSVLLLAGQAASASATVIQILHTNDLHSYWEHSLERDRGGYARIKALMDKLEEEGNQKGWVTIRLDAGDFSDGNIDYLAGRGVYSFELIKMMGYDVVALGNHDYVTGVDPLVWHASVQSTRLPLVAANFDSNKATNVVPGRIITRGGLRIAVGGATTDDPVYRWMALPATISEPFSAVEDWLSQQHADLRIALTHIGLYDDLMMVRDSHAIDLVIGGHSHHTLHKPRYALNFDKHIVPVVQAGYHGRYLGQTVVELPVGGATILKRYNLIPITADLPEDTAVAKKVKEGAFESHLGQRDLDKPVAFSNDTLFVYRLYNSQLGNFIADSLREAAHTDVAFDIGSLYGLGLPKGDVMVKDVYNLQPHTFDINGQGWRVFVASVSGKNLKKILSLASWSGNSFIVSGLKAELDWLHRVKWMTVEGSPVDDHKKYTLATSEGTVEAVSHYPRFMKILPPPYINTHVLAREMLLTKAKEQKFFPGNQQGEVRVTFPGSDKPVRNRTCGECEGERTQTNEK